MTMTRLRLWRCALLCAVALATCATATSSDLRAVRMHGYGGPEVLRIERVTAPPAPEPGHVRIRVHSAGVNPIDWKIRGRTRGKIVLRVHPPLGEPLPPWAPGQ